jgi:hypothetical protein
MMNTGRPPIFGKEASGKASAGKSTAGKTRICPHCKSTILDSASICPACQHHLRFGPAAEQQTLPNVSPLKVEGIIRHPPGGEPWEYSIVIAVRNERGEEITRQVVGVGALQPMEQRTFHLSVEMFAPAGSKSFK